VVPAMQCDAWSPGAGSGFGAVGDVAPKVYVGRESVEGRSERRACVFMSLSEDEMEPQEWEGKEAAEHAKDAGRVKMANGGVNHKQPRAIVEDSRGASRFSGEAKQGARQPPRLCCDCGFLN